MPNTDFFLKAAMWVLTQASLLCNMKLGDFLLHLYFLKITAANALRFQMLCFSSLPLFNSLTVICIRCNKSYYACSRVYESACLHSYFTEMSESCCSSASCCWVYYPFCGNANTVKNFPLFPDLYAV